MRCFVLGVLLVGVGTAALRGDDTRDLIPPSVAARVPDFRLKDSDGRARSLAEFPGARAFVVVFIGTECPLANLYVPTLRELDRAYRAKGVRVIAINANDQDTPAEVAAHARKRQIEFPVLKDTDQRVAASFGARRTPEAFLLDAGRVIRYHGRIDDQYGIGYQRDAPREQDLQNAIDDLLAGRPVRLPLTDVSGCVIGRRAAAARPPDSPGK